MPKLSPPYLEGSIIAQYGNDLIIPFKLNRATGINNVSKIYARIKTVATGRWLGTIDTTIFSKAITDVDYKATFKLENTKLQLTPGQYYKIQLAFEDKNEILGYYSSIGVFKYTTKPEVYIEGLNENKIGNLYTYNGVYSQKDGDITEKIYSYSFTVRQSGELIATSGIQLHDSTEDVETYMSKDIWVLNQQLKHGLIYEIEYAIKTINGIELSCKYNITNNEIDIDDELDQCSLIIENNYENGYIKVKLFAPEGITKTGGFVISRASSKDNYETWYDLMKFTLINGAAVPTDIWVDYSVEQGVGYKYSLQRYNNNGFYSTRLTNEEPVISDFEDIFLYDGNRQLRVRFNPKVTSFKNTVLESKLDTIGGQYPFIFRNGDVKYKEFPISGLISYLSDPEELFMSNKELGFVEEDAHRHSTGHGVELRSVTRGTQVDTNNIQAERKFKLSVLEWLTNGQPKLFRSPGEGNYIVRLMNTSLSPNDTVGRMIHTFSSTAYEIAENTFDNLMKFGFIENQTYNGKVMAVESVDLNFNNWPYNNLIQNHSSGVYFAEFRNVPPGTIFNLQFLNGAGIIPISIPANGFYKVNIYEEPLMSITLKSLPARIKQLTGVLDIGYYVDIDVGDFSEIRRISISDKLMQQIGGDKDFIASNEDIKFKFGAFYWTKMEARPVLQVYLSAGKYYYDATYKNEVDELNNNIKTTYLYQVVNKANTWIDGYHFLTLNEPDFNVYMRTGDSDRTERIYLGQYAENDGYYELPLIEKINYMKVGSGIMLDTYCQQKEYIYGLEEDDAEVAQAKAAWEADPNNKEKYNNFINILNSKRG